MEDQFVAKAKGPSTSVTLPDSIDAFFRVEHCHSQSFGSASHPWPEMSQDSLRLRTWTDRQEAYLGFNLGGGIRRDQGNAHNYFWVLEIWRDVRTVFWELRGMGDLWV